MNNVYQKSGRHLLRNGGPRQYVGSMDDSGEALGGVHTLRRACMTDPFPHECNALDDFRADLRRGQSRRTYAGSFSFLDQRDDPARERHLESMAIGNFRDDALQIVDLGATATLQIFIHR